MPMMVHFVEDVSAMLLLGIAAASEFFIAGGRLAVRLRI
jgi:hypothetical protein